MKKLKAIFCVFFGHSRIVDMCFGYVYCGRCRDQIGDTLGSIFPAIKESVIIGHNCPECKKNWKKLTWKDKFLVLNPFKKEEKK